MIEQNKSVDQDSSVTGLGGKEAQASPDVNADGNSKARQNDFSCCRCLCKSMVVLVGVSLIIFLCVVALLTSIMILAFYEAGDENLTMQELVEKKADALDDDSYFKGLAEGMFGKDDETFEEARARRREQRQQRINAQFVADFFDIAAETAKEGGFTYTSSSPPEEPEEETAEETKDDESVPPE